jgi:hypothetical protein
MSKLAVFMVMGKYCRQMTFGDNWCYFIDDYEMSPLYSYDITPSVEHILAWIATTIKTVPYTFHPILKEDDVSPRNAIFTVDGRVYEVQRRHGCWCYFHHDGPWDNRVSPEYPDSIEPSIEHFTAWICTTIRWQPL